MVEIKRQTREFGIQPIGVLRAPQAGQSIAEAVVSAADQLYRRSYEIARDQAVKRGGELAAETDINLITTFDANNKLPMAMELTQTMGRFSREAFEKVTLQRFEQTIADDIQNTKAIMMERYQDSPKAFEAAFSQYLEGTGANASGFYKQVIVDRGASALEDGRTRLQIVQMNKIRAEAQAAKKKSEDAYIENMFNIGASGGAVAFDQADRATKRISNQHTDYVDAGISPSSKPEFLEKARSAYMSGRLSAAMADPNVAVDSGLIQLYMQSGGQKSVYEMMGPAARSVVRQMEVMSGVDTQIDYMKFANENKDVFEISKDVGAAIANNARARSEAEAAAEKNSAILFDVTLAQTIDSNIYAGWGQFATASYIQYTKRQLVDEISKYDPRVIGRDAYNSILSKIDSAEKQLTEGVVRRFSSMFNSRDPSGQTLSVFAEALAAGDQATLADMIPPIFYNILASEVAGEGEALSSIAKNWKQGGDIVRNKEKSLIQININEDATALKSTLGDDTVPFEEKQIAYAEFKEKHGKYTNLDIVQFFQSINSDLSSKMTTLQNAENQKNFNLGANSISTDTTSTNFTSNVADLNALAAKTGQTGTTAHIDAAQKTVTAAAYSSISNILSNIPDAAMRSQQLKAASIYADTGNPNDAKNLLPEFKAEIDKALGTSTNIEGNVVSANRTKISEELSSEAEAVSKSFAQIQAIQQEQTDLQSLGSGTLVGKTAEETSQLISQAVGLASLPSDLFMRLPANEAEAEANAVALSIANRGVIPKELKYAASQVMNGTASPEQAQIILGYIRSNLFTVDATGKMSVNEGVVREFGPTESAKLEALISAAEMAPIGAEGSYVIAVGEKLRNPMSDEIFNELTGYDNPAQMLANIGVPSSLMDEFVPLAMAMATVHRGNAYKIMEAAVEKRFTKNPNGYDPLTGGSTVRHHPESFGYNIKAFEIGVAEIVEKLSTEDNRLSFSKRSTYGIGLGIVSIEELRAEPNYLPGQIVQDVVGNATEARANLGIARRVFYGPTPASTTFKPQWQLYAADQNGFVTVVPNSAFTADSLPIAKALGKLTPPESPTLPVKDGKISAEAIAAALPPDMAEEVQEQTDKAATVRTPSAEAPPQVPASIALTVDQTLVNGVVSILGKNSEAAKLMPMISESAGKNTSVAYGQLRKVIRAMGELRTSPRRDEILSQLLELQGKLRGQN
jgi:hypothetical protein